MRRHSHLERRKERNVGWGGGGRGGGGGGGNPFGKKAAKGQKQLAGRHYCLLFLAQQGIELLALLR